MMRYSLLTFLNQQKEPIAFLYLDTNAGRVVILFRDQRKLHVVAEYAIRNVLKPGHLMGAVEREFSSTEEVARQLRKDDPLLSDAAFLPDSDPFVIELLEVLLEEMIPLRAHDASP
jgi:hypothetical protein